MKYQSELIKEIVEARGHQKSSLHYESECVETWIEEAKGAYPKLCDYEGEWLNYISVLDDTGGGEEPEPPIGEFPYVVLSDVTEATVDNVVPYAYKSAILGGNTLVNVVSEQGFGGNNILYESRFFNSPINSGEKMTIFVVNPLVRSIHVGFQHSNNGEWSHETNYDVTTNKRIVCTVPKDKFSQYVAVVVSNANNSTGYENSMVILKGDYSQLEISTYFEGMQSVQMPVLMTSNEDGTNSNILRVNEDVTLCGIGDVKDELDCLTGELTQRVGEYVITGNESNIVLNTMGSHPMVEIVVKGIKTNSHITSDKINEATSPIYSSNQTLGIDVVDNAIRIRTQNILDGQSLEDFKKLVLPLTIKYQLATELVKTVDLSIQNQDGKTLNRITPFEGTMHLSTSSDTIKPLFSGEIPVEAITQNLASFIDLETEE